MILKVKFNFIFSQTVKPLFLFYVFCISFASVAGCSGTKVSTNTKNLKKSKYFVILADADDDPIFVKLQDDLNIDPKMERYTITVDIRAAEPGQQYVLFGDEYNPTRFMWSQLSEQVQKGLINWTGSNKEKLDY
jgi:hypothetical protein